MDSWGKSGMYLMENIFKSVTDKPFTNIPSDGFLLHRHACLKPTGHHAYAIRLENNQPKAGGRNLQGTKFLASRLTDIFLLWYFLHSCSSELNTLLRVRTGSKEKSLHNPSATPMSVNLTQCLIHPGVSSIENYNLSEIKIA